MVDNKEQDTNRITSLNLTKNTVTLFQNKLHNIFSDRFFVCLRSELSFLYVHTDRHRTIKVSTHSFTYKQYHLPINNIGAVMIAPQPP